MNRVVASELLDELPPDDPRAVRSRRDLRRVNAWMSNHAIMARALQRGLKAAVPGQITDLGAGDGDFLLRVARRLATGGADRLKLELQAEDVRAVLLDRQKIVSAETLAAFSKLGWRVKVIAADAFDWLPDPGEVVVANLFLHHFKDDRLGELFRAVAGRSKFFIAVEPRRTAWPLFCCRWLWAIGCNAVTRHDAAASVRAGFAGGELSALWPETGSWQLTERRAGLFSHLFIARRAG